LLEIGNHNQAANALFNNNYAEFLGIMSARALLRVLGLLKDDGAVTVACPPDQQRWRGVPQPLSSSAVKTIVPDSTYPLLVRGMKGSYVKQMQKLPVQHGCKLPEYGADGDFGDETLEALKLWQYRVVTLIKRGGARLSESGVVFSMDGKCGKWTWGSLLQLWG
jgi:peptidoglycan hydrolase-like protein with peptidoglycan-binding domain